MTRKAQTYLFDISQAISDIKHIHLQGITQFTEFEANKTVRRAVAKELEIIGEAAYRLRHMSVTLSQADSLINRRNTLIHQYSDYKDETIWYYIQGEIDTLKEEVDSLLE